jgi:hypothetical protein
MRTTLFYLALGSAFAQARAQIPEIQPIGEPTAVGDSIPLERSINVLSDGRVVVADSRNGWIALYDSSLKTRRVVMPGQPPTAGASRGTYLLGATGDTTLALDPASGSFTVLDRDGKVVRVIAVPRSQDAMYMGSYFAKPGIDPQGRVVYRVSVPPSMTPAGPKYPDSAAVVRTSFETRRPDTVAYLKIPQTRVPVTTVADDGSRTVTTTISILPPSDDWAMMSDGTIAVVRYRDYHIDWFAPDGTRRSSPPVAWPWKRLTDEDKQRMIEAREPWRRSRDSAAAASASTATGRGGISVPVKRVTVFESPSEIPDYAAPFADGQTRADRLGRLWVREQTIKPDGEPVWLNIYDVFDREGRLIDRVSMPENVFINGFGLDGAVYAVTPKSPTHMQLLRFSYKGR